MNDKKPTGFIARCQCGSVQAALDADRTERKEMSALLGRWLARGLIVEPRFSGLWEEVIEACKCNDPAPAHTSEVSEQLAQGEAEPSAFDGLEPKEMLRRLKNQASFMTAYATALDGIPEVQNISGGGIDACRMSDNVRAIVMHLINKAAPPAKPDAVSVVDERLAFEEWWISEIGHPTAGSLRQHWELAWSAWKGRKDLNPSTPQSNGGKS